MNSLTGKYKLFLFTILAILSPASFTSHAHASTAPTKQVWLDSFGKFWNVKLYRCREAGMEQCISGHRDPDNSIGCGPLLFTGTIANKTLTLTLYTNPGSRCVTSTWIGSFYEDPSRYQGIASDREGNQNAFWISSSHGAAKLPASNGSDPSLGRKSAR